MHFVFAILCFLLHPTSANYGKGISIRITVNAKQSKAFLGNTFTRKRSHLTAPIAVTCLPVARTTVFRPFKVGKELNYNPAPLTVKHREEKEGESNRDNEIPQIPMEIKCYYLTPSCANWLTSLLRTYWWLDGCIRFWSRTHTHTYLCDNLTEKMSLNNSSITEVWSKKKHSAVDYDQYSVIPIFHRIACGPQWS